MNKILLIPILIFINFNIYANDDSNINKHYSEGLSCDLGYAEACFNMGERYYDVEFDTDKAMEYWQQGCDLGHADSCHYSGYIYYERKEYKKSIEIYNKFCNLGHQDSCNSLGVAYALGKGVTQNIIKAFNLFTTACNSDLGSACHNLALIYETGEEGIEKDRQKEISFYIKGCDLDYTPSCFELAQMYRYGDVVRKDIYTAKEIFKHSCDLGHEISCNALNSLGRL